MDKMFAVDGQTLRILRAPDLADAEVMQGIRQALQGMIDAAPGRITIDFSDAHALSSSIIGITLLAVELGSHTQTAVSVHAPMRHHQALVAAGLTRLADLRLCG